MRNNNALTKALMCGIFLDHPLKIIHLIKIWLVSLPVVLANFSQNTLGARAVSIP